MAEQYQMKSGARGKNRLEDEEQQSMAESLLGQLNDPLIFILFVAAAISLLLKEYGDMAIILAVVLVNAIVGVIQEGRAKKALEALKQLTSPHAFIREGEHIREIPAVDLVPGDIVVLEAGCQVPADLKLTLAVNLKIEESALTGESVPVSKNLSEQNCAYMSTNVTYGRGEGVVTAIDRKDRPHDPKCQDGDDAAAEASGRSGENFEYGIYFSLRRFVFYSGASEAGRCRDADHGDLSRGGGGSGRSPRYCNYGVGI